MTRDEPPGTARPAPKTERRMQSGAEGAPCRICTRNPATLQETGGRWVCQGCGNAIARIAERLGPEERRRLFPPVPEDRLVDDP